MIYDFSEDVKNKKILIAPLNWGLGHATRCIPIIRRALSLGAEIIIASDGQALEYLRKIFPKLETIELPSYNVNYKYRSMIINGMIQLPKVLSAINGESKAVDQIVSQYNIDLIISDNRFGCHSEKTRNVFITHQLNILHPIILFKYAVNYQNRRWLNNFKCIWVPDYMDARLSGKLSITKSIEGNIKYIGPQSIHKDLSLPAKYDILFLLSGPEPQRTKFEHILIQWAIKLTEFEICFVSGTNKSPIISAELPHHIDYHTMVYGDELTSILNQSEIVVSRSGYSTIMDLDKLNKKCILIATPGQTEQEYLAQKMSAQSYVRSCKQENLNKKLRELIKDLKQVS